MEDRTSRDGELIPTIKAIEPMAFFRSRRDLSGFTPGTFQAVRPPQFFKVTLAFMLIALEFCYQIN
jgi:hypothetical protein